MSALFSKLIGNIKICFKLRVRLSNILPSSVILYIIYSYSINTNGMRCISRYRCGNIAMSRKFRRDLYNTFIIRSITQMGCGQEGVKSGC